jgi:hypothetical protein
MATKSLHFEAAAIPPLARAEEFARTAARLLGLPDALSADLSSREPYSFTEIRKQWGSASAGVELQDRTDEIERGHYTMSVRSFRIYGYGLEQGAYVSARFGKDGASCDVILPSEAAVDAILSAFTALMQNRPLPPPSRNVTPVDVDRLLRSAANACNLEYWADAEKLARQALVHRPGDAEAQEVLSRALARRK